MNKISVLIVDDHAFLRYGLRKYLEREPDIEVVAEGTCASDVMQLLSQYVPDVLLLDLHLPDKNGHDVIREIRAAGGGLPILVMTGDVMEHARNAIDAGANGFLTKAEHPARFLGAVRWAASGEFGVWISSTEISEQRQTDAAITRAGLTRTELRILQLLERSNTEIAAKLCLSVGTVKNHVTRIYSKIGVNTRIAAFNWAHANGIF